MFDERDGQGFAARAKEVQDALGVTASRWLWVDGEGLLVVHDSGNAYLFGMGDDGHVAAIRTVVANADNVTGGDYVKHPRVQEILRQLADEMVSLGRRTVNIHRPLGIA